MRLTMSMMTNYLNSFIADFSRNGLIWFKRWATNNEDSKRIARAVDIDEETMEIKIVAELNSADIDYFIRSFEEIVSPKPVPPYCLVVVLSPCSNAVNIFSSFSLSIPIPVSMTAQ